MNYKNIAAIEAILGNKPDKIPDGWYSVNELAKKFKVSRACMGSRITRIQEKIPKKVLIKTFRISMKNKLVTIPHYFFKL